MFPAIPSSVCWSAVRYLCCTYLFRRIFCWLGVRSLFYANDGVRTPNAIVQRITPVPKLEGPHARRAHSLSFIWGFLRGHLPCQRSSWTIPPACQCFDSRCRISVFRNLWLIRLACVTLLRLQSILQLHFGFPCMYGVLAARLHGQRILQLVTSRAFFPNK